jgi:predicted dehydrogenase
MSRLTRRDFIRNLTAAACVGFGSAASARTSSKVLGANDDIRIAIVGLRKKGKEHLDLFGKVPGVRIVALCDVDTEFLDFEAGKFKDRNEKVATYVDYRKLLDNKDIDAVVIVAPDHWHALMMVWACQAGKDVYVEKPASHNIWEGRKMVEAARKHGRIVYSACLARSASSLPNAFAWAREGHLGKILYAHGLNYKPRMSIGKVSGPQAIPSYIDYDLWCGPAPVTPLMREHLHYDWHWDFNYGNGDIGNMGIHYMDACRMALGQDTLPTNVLSIGGRFGYEDDGQTPNTMITFLDYKPAPIIFEVRGLPAARDAQKQSWAKNMDKYRDVSIGIVVHCEEGYIAQNKAFDKAGNLIKEFEATDPSGKANFLKVMRSRRVGDLQGDILDGHISASLVHMANISYRCGAKTGRDELAAAASGNDRMKDAFGRFAGHLEANGIDVDKAGVVLGASLAMDNKKERFVGAMSNIANKYVSKNYRKGFEVPDNI